MVEARRAQPGAGHGPGLAPAIHWSREVPMPSSVGSWACVSAVLAAAPLTAAPRTYVVDPAQSSVRIHVGKSGAFSFAGHKHEVVAPSLSGEVTADAADLSASRVAVTFDAA